MVSGFQRKITNLIKCVTVMMIDGVCFPGVYSSCPGMGGVYGGTIRGIAAVKHALVSQGHSN